MLRFRALPILALLALPCHASWRLETGLSFSWLGNKDTLDAEFSSYAAPALGISYEVPVGRAMCLLPGLSIENKGEKVSATFNEYIKLSYLQLPLLVNWRTTTPTGQGLHLSAGPEMGWRWKGQIEGAFRNFEANREIRRFDLGAKLGGALEFSGAQASLLLGVSYFHGLLNPRPKAGNLANRNLKLIFGMRI